MRTRILSSNHPVPSPGPSVEQGVKHRPVLLHEVSSMLDVQREDVVLDATLGGAGHAEKLVQGLGGNGLFIGFDADSDAIKRARNTLADSRAPVRLVCGNFRNIADELDNLGVKSITKVLFDLGWSSYQLDSGLPAQAGRGFSFRADEPLLMTYQQELKPDTVTAAIVVNTWGEESLADIIYGFGEERYSRRIAKAIAEYRLQRPITSSRELSEIIKDSVPIHYRRGKIHPATRTFQALRIAVNDELGALSIGLDAVWKRLAPGGRIAVISFHSIEDRIVKRMFAAWAKKGEGRLCVKKPIVPTREEILENPRSRSAKLRVVEKEKVIKNIVYENSHSKNKQIYALDFSGEA